MVGTSGVLALVYATPALSLLGDGDSRCGLLRRMAAGLWSSRSASGRHELQLAARRMFPDAGKLLVRKNAECRDELNRSGDDLHRAYAAINAADFRAGRTLRLSSVVFSEIDVALLLMPL